MSVLLNSADKHIYITLSNGDLTATSITVAAWHGVRCTWAHISGKRQVEFHVGTASGAISIGIATVSADKSVELGASAAGWGYKSTGVKKNTNTETAYGAAYAAGDVIGLVLDQNASSVTLTFYKNGVSQGTAYSGISRASAFYIMVSLYEVGDAVTVNFGATAFSYPVTGAEEYGKAIDVSSVAQAIGQDNAGYVGKAYDGSMTDPNATGSWYCYWGGGYKTTGWTGQHFAAPQVINQYRIFIDSAMGSHAPKSWTFEGSNDNFTTPVTLHTVTNTAPAAGVWTAYPFSNGTAYADYRINVSANNGGGYLIIQEMEFLASDGGTVLEDFSLCLSAGFQGFETLPLFLAAASNEEISYLCLLLHARGNEFENLALLLWAAATVVSDLELYLAATNGEQIEGPRLYLSAHNGIEFESLSLRLSAMRRPPSFRSISAQRLASVLSEVV